jgi:nicotinamide-nucleotide amidase
MDEQLERLAAEIGAALKARGLWLATAESCTGGWIGEAVTSVSGSSQWYDRGFITYTNQAKQDILGVNEETLEHHGAVSEQTVREMAQGTLQHSRADVSLAISGIAGPTGGTAEKPVGLVWFAWSAKNGATRSEKQVFSGDRREVRRQAVEAALKGVLALLEL